MQLICEGACNPTIDNVDRMVAEFRRRDLRGNKSGPIDPVPDELAAELRKLKYTAHHATGEIRAACGVCGHERTYGSLAVPRPRRAPEPVPA